MRNVEKRISDLEQKIQPGKKTVVVHYAAGKTYEELEKEIGQSSADNVIHVTTHIPRPKYTEETE